MKFSNFDDQHLKNLNVFHINIILGFQRSAKKNVHLKPFLVLL